jgi:hypothetical protein
MNSSKWGPSGWILIHTVSQLGLKPKHYFSFLEKLQHILPCKYCRNNFWRNLHSLKHSLPHESSQLPLWSIHIHNTVSLDLDPDADIWEPTKTLHLLPEVSVETLFPQEFFYAVSLNITDEKRIPVLRDFLDSYHRLLESVSTDILKPNDMKLIDKAFTTLENDLSNSEKLEKETLKKETLEKDVIEPVKISMIHFTDVLVSKNDKEELPKEKDIVKMVYRSGDKRIIADSNFIRKTRKSKYVVGSAISQRRSISRKRSS